MRDFVSSVKRVALNAFRRDVPKLGFFSRGPAYRPALIVEQKLRRVKWAKEHVHWTEEQPEAGHLVRQVKVHSQ